MTRSLKQFVADALLPNNPPAVPLRLPHWAGLAFDRNRYSDLAPANIWDAIFKVQSCRASEVAVISSADVEWDRRPVLVAASREALVAWLGAEGRFLSDHYVYSQAHDWLCRLDQDVTLIAGDVAFIRDVVANCGGLNTVMEQMLDDFDPGTADSVSLRRYLDELTRSLREHT